MGSTEDASTTEEIDMSIMDKVKQLVGGAKEKVGDMTGNDDMAASGKADQAKGDVKEMGHDIQDKAPGAVKDVKDELSN